MVTDYSYIKEIVVSSIFRSMGLKSPRVSPVRVELDNGDGKGPVYWGSAHRTTPTPPPPPPSHSSLPLRGREWPVPDDDPVPATAGCTP